MPDVEPEPDLDALLKIIVDGLAEKLDPIMDEHFAALQGIVAAETAALRRELETLTFEGRSKLLGTITFTRIPPKK